MLLRLFGVNIHYCTCYTIHNHVAKTLYGTFSRIKEEVQSLLTACSPLPVHVKYRLDHLHLCGFTSYSSLEYLIDYMDGEGHDIGELKISMAEYSEDVQFYMKTTTVQEFVDHCIPLEPCFGYLQLPFEISHLEVRFGTDPGECTLQQLDEFRKTICNKVGGLSDDRLTLHKLVTYPHPRPNTIVATWVFPSRSLDEVLLEMSTGFNGFYRKEDFKSVKVDKKTLVRSL